MLSSEECVVEWGTHKGRSAEYQRQVCSAHRPQRFDGGFGHKCSVSLSWTMGLWADAQPFSNRLTPCHQCQAHSCGLLPIGSVFATCVSHRSFEHLGLIMVHVSCLDDPWIQASSSPCPALSKLNTYLFLVSSLLATSSIPALTLSFCLGHNDHEAWLGLLLCPWAQLFFPLEKS